MPGSYPKPAKKSMPGDCSCMATGSLDRSESALVAHCDAGASGRCAHGRIGRYPCFSTASVHTTCLANRPHSATGIWTMLLQSLPETLTRGITAATCSRALHTALPITPLPLLIDALDTDPQRHTRLSWRHAITHQVSQTCAAYFDQHQAQWLPDRTRGFTTFGVIRCSMITALEC